VIALFWDIDGTLLTTGRAGVFALEDALDEVFGVRFDLMAERLPSGMTEHDVAAAVFELAGVVADEEQTDRFIRAYERALPASLPRREGRVLPGVREILEDLAPRSDVQSFLLTGNTPAGALAKLEHYGLDGFFADGAYCIAPGPRTVIAHRAVELAPDADERYVIGDTPHDVDAAKAIGARSIALATGGFSVDELAAHEPWLTLETLPPPAEFRALLALEDPVPEAG
jgi:phosphoglycolate phosphatase